MPGSVAGEDPEQWKFLEASSKTNYKNKKNSLRVLIFGAPYSAVPSALDVSARVLSLAIWEEGLGSRAHEKCTESRP